MSNAARNIISLDEQLLQDVINGVTGVFKEGFAIDVKYKSHQIARNQSVAGDVSGIVGLLQDRIEGNLVMCFSKSAIFQILGGVYQRQFTEIDGIVKEGAAEMTNMVYGRVKTCLNDRGHGLKMALPNVITGSSHQIASTADCKSLVATFSFDRHEFSVIIALQDQN